MFLWYIGMSNAGYNAAHSRARVDGSREIEIDGGRRSDRGAIEEAPPRAKLRACRERANVFPPPKKLACIWTAFSTSSRALQPAKTLSCPLPAALSSLAPSPPTMAATMSAEPSLEPTFGRSVSLPDDDKKDFVDETVDVPGDVDVSTRPPIDYSSVGAFSRSVWSRFVSLWTKRFILSLLAGQVVSLCITCTNVTTTELVNRNWALPTTQTFFLWVPSGLSLE